MSEILSRPMVEALLRDRRRLPSSADLLWDCDAALRAENERLREALREIAEHVCIWRVGNGPECRRCYSCIARAALAEVGK